MKKLFEINEEITEVSNHNYFTDEFKKYKLKNTMYDNYFIGIDKEGYRYLFFSMDKKNIH